MVRFFLAAALMTTFCAALPACNTTKGAGQDMKAAGQSIENSADKHGANP
jgi:predicted small secreted protein